MRKPASLPSSRIKPKRRSMSLRRRPSSTREPILSRHRFFPYLQGYVAFYAGDYKAALEELLKANQNDPSFNAWLGRPTKSWAMRRRPWSITARLQRQSRIIPPLRTLYR